MTAAESTSWKIETGLVDYPYAHAFMEKTVQGIISRKSPELIWCLQHPPLFTAGTSAKEHDLFNPLGFPVYSVGRGGQYTYHGPGQLVVYVMVNLEHRQKDVHQFVKTLEQWGIDTLNHFGIHAERREGRPGLWVVDTVEEKIAAIGVRITKWVTWHGMAINIHPNLDHFQGIIPCGLRDFGVTSFEKCGRTATILDVIDTLQKTCPYQIAPHSAINKHTANTK
ncbi:MAG: lipoyl(octanoyl) transferase LipB [Alphaproteobacteria bacterium]|nr:lipoyl(octanoyl) transferase LipB [Alphaproteobacteria bacterium]